MSFPIIALVLVAVQSPPHTSGVPAPLAGVVRCEMAGHLLASAPGFTFDRTFIEGAPMKFSIDPVEHPLIQGANGYLFIVPHKTVDVWLDDPTLVDARGVAQSVWFPGTDLASNAQDVMFGPISGDVGDSFGKGYDLVLDMNWNAVLDAGDYIDGWGDTPGMWVVEPPQLPGHHAVTEILISGGTFLGEDIYYPTDVANMGALPLVVVSHLYTWYDHIGDHLASWGCIVMAHQNNTMPGPDSASLTTLSNTDYFLGHLNTIAGGALQGHVDSHRIVWIGHSRGGEGVARAYDRLFDQTPPLPVNFVRSDIKLVSSIAPTDFLGPTQAFPHGVPYHLWVGGGDSDVTGCADCDLCQSYHLFGRAEGVKHAIEFHGVGHGSFHDGGGDEWVTGPCQVHRADTHVLMKTQLVPLVKWYTEGTQASTDFFWRQWESFQPPGVPSSSCVVVDLQYIEGPDSGKLVIDDFQTNTATTLSSSGGLVQSSVDNLNEGRLHDPNTVFTYAAGEVMDGMTQAGPTDNSPGTRGCSFGWNNADKVYQQQVLPALGDLRQFKKFSFRACQMTRDVNTTPAPLGDLTLGIALVDAAGVASEINIGAYGGGIEEPYQRTACGTGAGWGNEFETIRIPLEDFQRVERALDLRTIRWVEFRVGPSHGSTIGRIGLDDIEFTRD
jgi:hypothetical protein